MLSSTSDLMSLSQPLASSSSLLDEPLGAADANANTAAANSSTPASVTATQTPLANTAASTPLSGSSLLERIQAQRAREQQPPTTTMTTTTTYSGNAPQPLVIPNYAPMSQNAVSGPNNNNGMSSSSSRGWFQSIFGNGAAASLSFQQQQQQQQQQRNQYRQVPGQDSSDALLTNFELADDDGNVALATQQQQYPPLQSATGPQPYSMAAYFHTFVMDMYHVFRSLPTWAQIPIVLLLMYLLWKAWQL